MGLLPVLQFLLQSEGIALRLFQLPCFLQQVADQPNLFRLKFAGFAVPGFLILVFLLRWFIQPLFIPFFVWW